MADKNIDDKKMGIGMRLVGASSIRITPKCERLHPVFIFLSSIFLSAPLPVRTAHAVDFQRDVLPVLAHECRKCHGSDKSKGGLRLHTREAALKGGENGPVIVPGESASSQLIARITSDDPDLRMPPKGDGLTPKEINILRAWIDEGMKWNEASVTRPYRMALREVKPPPGRGHPIDRILKPYFAERGITPPRPVSDEAFARRVYYDAIGLPTTPEELSRFLNDRAPDRRARLIRRALDDHPAYVGHWMTFWSDHFQVGSSIAGSVFNGDATAAPRDWLRNQLTAGKGYNYFVNDVIAGGFLDLYGRSLAPPGEETSAALSAPMQSATMVSHVFLGVQLKCASCHDSFIDRWSMEHAWGLASALTGGDLEIERCGRPTGRSVGPGFLFPEIGAIDPKLDRSVRLRRVAQLVVDGRNGLYHRTIANRIWARLFGRGLIEPLDEMIEHEAWHPELLEWLAKEIRRQGYDMKKFLHVIMTSDAYRFPGVARPGRPDEGYMFKGPEIRRLTAEQFVDTILLLSEPPGTPEKPSRPRHRAWQFRNDNLMTALARPSRDAIVTARDETAHPLQAFELINGPTLNDRLKTATASLKANLGRLETDAFIERVYRQLLSRDPAPRERKIATAMLAPNRSADAISDWIWALIALPEFQLLH